MRHGKLQTRKHVRSNSPCPTWSRTPSRASAFPHATGLPAHREITPFPSSCCSPRVPASSLPSPDPVTATKHPVRLYLPPHAPQAAATRAYQHRPHTAQTCTLLRGTLGCYRVLQAPPVPPGRASANWSHQAKDTRHSQGKPAPSGGPSSPHPGDIVRKAQSKARGTRGAEPYFGPPVHVAPVPPPHRVRWYRVRWYRV